MSQGALPIALAAEDVAVRSLVPGYPSVLAGLKRRETVADLGRLFGGPARLLAGFAGELALFVIDAPHLYDRPGNPYGFDDDAFRFAALGVVAARISRDGAGGFRPDILHAHDWQAGLAAAYLHYGGAAQPGTVMTIHNLAFQGRFPAELLGALQLPPGAFDIAGVEYYGGIGFLKAGLALSDCITTVSPSYRRGDPHRFRRHGTGRIAAHAGGCAERDPQRHRYRHLESGHRHRACRAVRCYAIRTAHDQQAGVAAAPGDGGEH